MGYATLFYQVGGLDDAHVSDLTNAHESHGFRFPNTPILRKDLTGTTATYSNPKVLKVNW